MVAQLPISLSGVTVRRAGQTLLGPLDVTLLAPGITMVLGPNGAGKTTFLRLLHGMERKSAGRIDWPTDPRGLRGQQAFVFQRPTMMRRSVLDNLAYPLRLSGMAMTRARETARAHLEQIGLGAKADLAAHHLSGGERQKLALARALIREPSLVFLDEPCASLDGAAVRDIEAMLGAARARGVAAIMATHDLGQARRLADQVLFLHKGRALEHGPAAAFFDAPGTPEGRAFLDGDILT